jgi:hypothetical protein
MSFQERVDDIVMLAEILRIEVSQTEVSQARNSRESRLGDALETHAPLGVLALRDLVPAQYVDVAMARILGNSLDQWVNNRALSFNRLKEGAVAKEQHAGEAFGRVVAMTLRE